MIILGVCSKQRAKLLHFFEPTKLFLKESRKIKFFFVFGKFFPPKTKKSPNRLAIPTTKFNDKYFACHILIPLLRSIRRCHATSAEAEPCLAGVTHILPPSLATDFYLMRIPQPRHLCLYRAAHQYLAFHVPFSRSYRVLPNKSSTAPNARLELPHFQFEGRFFEIRL